MITALCRCFLFFYGLVNCSSNLHMAMLTSLLKAPVHFFDRNPVGRILNRFANDIGSMDEVLPYALLEAVQYIMFTISVLILVSVANFWVIGASVPFTVLALYISRRHIRAARDMKRIDAVSCSAVCTHVADTIQGIATIRVYKRQEDFIGHFYRFAMLLRVLICDLQFEVIVESIRAHYSLTLPSYAVAMQVQFFFQFCHVSRFCFCLFLFRKCVLKEK